jgi:hypothetical protein
MASRRVVETGVPGNPVKPPYHELLPMVTSFILEDRRDQHGNGGCAGQHPHSQAARNDNMLLALLF